MIMAVNDNDPYAGIESEEERQAIYQALLEKYHQEESDYTRMRNSVYDPLIKDWSEYREIQLNQDSLFNKYITTITAGLFGVSFAFIDKIVPFQTADYRVVMVCGWALFALTLIAAITCHLASSFVHGKYCEDVAENIRRGYEGKPFIQRKRWYYHWALNVLYAMSFLGFLGGIACLILFVILNI
jgi:hypothetical protein